MSEDEGRLAALQRTLRGEKRAPRSPIDPSTLTPSSLPIPTDKGVSADDYRRKVGKPTVQVGQLSGVPEHLQNKPLIDMSTLTPADDKVISELNLDLRKPEDVKTLETYRKMR